MSWVKVDDKAWSHPKFTDLSGNAVRLWLFALCWCNQQETDGNIPRGALRVLGGSPKDARALVAAGLWVETDSGWVVHDFLTYQPSKAQRNAQREMVRERVARHRNGARNRGSGRDVTPLHGAEKPTGNDAPDPDPDPVPDPVSVDDDARGAPPEPRHPGRVPCPPDLELTAAERAQLAQSPGIPAEAIDRATPVLRAKFASGDPRTLEQWRRSLVSALVRDWSDPAKRDEMLGRAPPTTSRSRSPRGPVQPNHGQVDLLAMTGAKVLR